MDKKHKHPLAQSKPIPIPNKRPRLIIYGILHRCEHCLSTVEIFPEEYIKEVKDRNLEMYFICPVCNKKTPYKEIKLF